MVGNHISREAWYQVKPYVKSDWGWSETILGAFDSTFLLCYACGLYMMGTIQDKLSIRCVMPIGMGFSAVWIFFMAFFGVIDEPILGIYFALWALNGFSQAVVQPGTVDTVHNWFQEKYMGVVMGAFSSSTNFGDCCGTAVFSIVILGAGAAWPYTTMITSFTMALIALNFAIQGRERPPAKYATLLLDINPGSQVTPNDLELTAELNEPKEGVGFFKAWTVPGVAIYAVTYAFVKLVFYGMLMWLPYYVKEGLGRPTYDPIILAYLFDIGSLCGAIIQGRIIDKFTYRNLILVPNLLFSIPIFLSFRFITGDEFAIFYVLVPIVGFFIGGVANLIPSLIAQDLGRDPMLDDNAVATITGILDGTGSFGAAIGQFVIGVLAQHYGWDASFAFICACCLVPALLLMTRLIKECREYKEMDLGDDNKSVPMVGTPSVSRTGKNKKGKNLDQKFLE